MGEGDRIDEQLKEVYETNASLILRRHQEGNVYSVYNFPIDNHFTVSEIMQAGNEIYDRQQKAFRLNLEFGLILKNTETGEYRYFKPYHNQEVFERPIYVSRRIHLKRLQHRMQQLNITDYILRQRPDTKWKPFLITNVRIVTYHLNFVLGNGRVTVPEHISQSKSVISMTTNSKGYAYKDNLCAFRCLAYHQNKDWSLLENQTQELFQKWVSFNKRQSKDINSNSKTFPGITLDQLVYFEKCFEINVNLFSLQEDGSAQVIYKSKCKYSNDIYLNIFEHHLSYITKFDTYAKKFQCKTCHRHFGHLKNLKKHQRVCKMKTKRQFPGGFYSTPNTIFDKLEQYGITVNPSDRLYEWFLVYDFESMLVPTDAGQNSASLQYTEQHVPVSVSVCSNVEDHTEPLCIVESNIDSLVEKMVEYMSTIAQKATELTKEKLSDVFSALEDSVFDERICEDALECIGDDEEIHKMINEEKKLSKKLKEEFESYCEQMICIGFNSAKYDINLIKSYLVKHLRLDENGAFVAKRNNVYSCISTNTFKFLDISQYLSPGINYSGFLRAFDVQESKGFFPYEFFDDIDKLRYDRLPPHEAFYSTLKNANITDEEYAFCQRVWDEKKMTTFSDFLVWYNNLDVEPFVQAVKNLQKYYFERGIDIFKCSISVPGLARRMLFESGTKEGASFALIDRENEDLYDTIKQNIIGGPSIIFKRYHETKRSFIRGNPQKPCGRIIGFDANALYLYCIGKEMPAGAFVRRRMLDKFKPQKRDKYTIAYDWLDWLSHCGKYKTIKHKLNSGKEKKLAAFLLTATTRRLTRCCSFMDVTGMVIVVG